VTEVVHERSKGGALQGPLAQPYELCDGKIQTDKCEVNVTEHCNLSCRACSHLSPVLARHSIDPGTLERDLSLLAPHYRARRILLLGGEPLLHPKLLDVIRVARRSGVGEIVTVVTNGVLLPRMPSGFWAAVDRVEVSLYPGKELTAEQIEACSRSAETHGVELNLSRIAEFRESYAELGTLDGRLVRRIYESCVLAHVWRCHTVADGYFYKCPPSYFIPKLIASVDLDALRIEDDAGFGDRLLRFLEDPTPLASCRNCLGSSGRRFAHSQTKRAEFRPRQRRTTEELLDPRYLVPAR
jgi:hypothetical protein